MMRLAAAVAVLLVAPAVAVALDCDACTDGVPCVRHQKEQEEALAKFKKLRQHKDPIQRKDALDALGKLNDDHMNYRNPTVAEEIAKLLGDPESGVRQAALGFLRTNQHKETAIKAIAAQVGKQLDKVRKNRPMGKAAEKGRELEWETNMAWYKMLYDALVELAPDEAVDPTIKALDTDNMFLQDHVAGKAAAIRDVKIVEALLKKAAQVTPTEDDEGKKRVFGSCAMALRALTQYPEDPGAMGEEKWVKGINAHWRTIKEEWEKPPEEKKEGE
jgi:HEAT repeat protein